MEVYMRPLLYLLLCMSCAVVGHNNKRFLIIAPSVFHVGVKEPIRIQVGEALLGKPVSCHLVTERHIPMSTRETITISKKGQFEELKLEIFANKASRIKGIKGEPPYLNLACEVDGQKWQTRILVSKQTGYIFIQTDQPIYNPKQKVWFRIFTLDHSMRPKSEIVHVSIYNAAGRKVKKSTTKVVDGILSKSYHIPDISKPGVWKITAHYKGDEENPAVREFKVQKFVPPSFEVTVQSEKAFMLVNAEAFTFTIQASHTYGKVIDGAFKCRFGMDKDESENNPGKIKFIKGLKKTGSVKGGQAEITVQISEIKQKLHSTLEKLAATQTRFYIAVTVTDILSGEVQESAAFIPIVLRPYNVDLSRTRSFYTPTFLFQAVVTVRHPNGSPAEGVQVKLDVSSTKEKSRNIITNKEGIAFQNFNLEGTPPSISVQATVDGFKSTKEVRPVKSTKNSFLYLSVTNKVLSPEESLDVTFYVKGNPVDGQIYYMIVSRGMLRTASSIASGSAVKISIQISPEMIPSFRVIAFYYTDVDIIADSVWVDVEGWCEGKLEINLNGNHNYEPEDSAELGIDVGTQNAKVALLVVDKAIYALGSRNKLTPKQVFRSMQSHDMGCSYGGGENAAAVFNDAGLAFISHSNTIRSMMRKGFSCESGFRCNKRSIEMTKKGADCNEEEEFFDFETVCRYFQPSFEFKQMDVIGKVRYTINLPHSITTWEIQALSVSPSHGFCVTEPVDLPVFKPVFISLRLPFSVKRFEQLSIVVVIFNYGRMEKKLVVQMKQVDGLCSPGSASSSSTVRISLEQQSSQTVTFPTVPTVTGQIPITIEVYDDEESKTKVASIQKMLLVKNEGVEIREEQTYFINLNGRNDRRLFIDGFFPNNTVPETDVSLFVKLEEEAFAQSTAVPLLSPSKVENLIRAPKSCGEQTMFLMSSTAFVVRYIDKTQCWLKLEAGSREKALDFIEQGYEHILMFQKPDGSYGAWQDYPTSTWLTALVVKVLSIVAGLQIETLEQQGTTERLISQEDIRQAVTYLIETQSSDGSFTDANPVIHREMQGVEQDASLTAFITIALYHSLPFLGRELINVEESISRATDFLLKRVGDLKRTYALAITAYCLSICLPDQTRALSTWKKLKSLANLEGECLVWQDDVNMQLMKKSSHVPPGMALTVETTAYALMTALEQNDLVTAHAAACFLSSQGNYEGGFKSTQDTVVALEALTEYALSIPETPITTVNAQFTVPGRPEMEKLQLVKNKKKVETELKRLVGREIYVRLSGKGKVKMKVAKTYYALKEDSNCADLSIQVTVERKVEHKPKEQESSSSKEDTKTSEERKGDSFHSKDPSKKSEGKRGESSNSEERKRETPHSREPSKKSEGKRGESSNSEERKRETPHSREPSKKSEGKRGESSNSEERKRETPHSREPSKKSEGKRGESSNSEERKRETPHSREPSKKSEGKRGESSNSEERKRETPHSREPSKKSEGKRGESSNSEERKRETPHSREPSKKSEGKRGESSNSEERKGETPHSKEPSKKPEGKKGETANSEERKGDTSHSKEPSKKSEGKKGETAKSEGKKGETANSEERKGDTSHSKEPSKKSEGKKGETANSEERKGDTSHSKEPSKKSEGKKGETAKSEGKKGETANSEERKGDTSHSKEPSKKSEGKKGETANSEERKGETANSEERKGDTSYSKEPSKKSEGKKGETANSEERKGETANSEERKGDTSHSKEPSKKSEGKKGETANSEERKGYTSHSKEPSKKSEGKKGETANSEERKGDTSHSKEPSKKSEGKKGETANSEERKGETPNSEERKGDTSHSKEPSKKSEGKKGETDNSEERKGDTSHSKEPSKKSEGKKGETANSEERKGETANSEERKGDTSHSKEPSKKSEGKKGETANSEERKGDTSHSKEPSKKSEGKKGETANSEERKGDTSHSKEPSKMSEGKKGETANSEERKGDTSHSKEPSKKSEGKKGETANSEERKGDTSHSKEPSKKSEGKKGETANSEERKGDTSHSKEPSKKSEGKKGETANSEERKGDTSHSKEPSKKSEGKKGETANSEERKGDTSHSKEPSKKSEGKKGETDNSEERRVETSHSKKPSKDSEERNLEENFTQLGSEWFDAHSRRGENKQNYVVYTVCVSLTQGRKLSGMAIADITLLSGFQAINTDLERLKDLVGKYISHYELTDGRVLLYFNEIDEDGTCIAFGAKQSVPIGLVQPAPATVYDYYEPDRRCSVLYSAPKRSNMVSVLCSDDVCQCAERDCFIEKKTIEMEINKKDRYDYACSHSKIDYAFEVIVDSVTEENNFILYSTSIKVVLQYTGDMDVSPDSTRVFAKRKHCKGELEEGETYLIMGDDSPTKDYNGNMKYLLDSKTWVEQKLSTSTCEAPANKIYCTEYRDFVEEYQVDGCNV
ncbi:complement C4-B-like isoform X9 [Megalobrama amblycephala]|uniref:complement C4-B-like isoform X9 n=1 Tax=Megalobrama amblycephala TaxID=75352 RepID=UPI002013EEB4|nr:complement C4-B-like isoform X9 [Megalobrama amblycephala]